MLSKFSVMILLWLGMMYSSFCTVSAISKLGYKLIYIRWRKTYCNRIVKPWVLTIKSQRMFSFNTVMIHITILITQWLIKVFTRPKRNSCHSLEGSLICFLVCWHCRCLFKDALYTNSERTQFKSISSYSGQEVYLIATPSINDFLLLILFLLWKVQCA